MTKISNKSPLRYPGGKTRACKTLDTILKDNFDVSKFDNIVIFNVLEHVFDIENATNEMKKILKSKGKIIISTPFIYRYHKAPFDYNRPTIDFYEKLAKKNNFKIIYKKNLGTGPFLASYSIMHNVIKYLYPLNILFLGVFVFIDSILNFFKSDLKNLYPICNFVIFQKK